MIIIQGFSILQTINATTYFLFCVMIFTGKIHKLQLTATNISQEADTPGTRGMAEFLQQCWSSACKDDWKRKEGTACCALFQNHVNVRFKQNNNNKHHLIVRTVWSFCKISKLKVERYLTSCVVCYGVFFLYLFLINHEVSIYETH